LLLCCALGLAACSFEERAWKRARASGSVEGYQAFLEEYAEGFFSAEAAKKVEELSYDRAKAAGTVEAFLEFLEKHPNGDLAEQARAAHRKADGERAQAVAREFGTQGEVVSSLLSEEVQAEMVLMVGGQVRMSQIIEKYGKPTESQTVKKGETLLANSKAEADVTWHRYGRLRLFVPAESSTGEVVALGMAE